MLTNYHTHTNFCDGVNTAEEMVLYAIARGFAAIGFSGHCTTPFDLRYCMQDTAGYIAEINRLKEKYRSKIQICLGIEEDIFATVNRADFDYIIGSSHYLHYNDAYYSVDSGMDYFEKCLALFNGDGAAYAEEYYRTFCNYIRTRKPDIVGHFDLITKYEESNGGILFQSPRYWEIAEKYLRQALENDVLFEVNTGAIYRGLRSTPYPHERLLTLMHQKDTKIILSADAHQADALDAHYEQCVQLLRQIGFRKCYILLDGQFQSINL